MEIRTVNTWYGQRYALMTPAVFYERNEKGEMIQKNTHHIVEYSDNNKRKVAMFPLTKKGLESAKELKRQLVR